MLEKTGVPTQADIESVFPSDERLLKGPVAVIECFQRIPCNPCATFCPTGAIQPFKNINDLPVIDESKCNGCALCLSRCPGLAIMVADAAWSADMALITLPYEFSPLPKRGQIVLALDREGEPVAEAEVIRIQNTPAMDKTPIISVAVDKNLLKVVRNIRVAPEKESRHDSAGVVCRCNDLDLEQIRELISQGFTSIDELKRVSRLGMGFCQGRNCIPIVLGELSRALKKPVEELHPGTYRPTVKSMKLGELAAYDDSDNKDDENNGSEGGI